VDTQSDHISVSCNSHCACAMSRDSSLGGGQTRTEKLWQICCSSR